MKRAWLTQRIQARYLRGGLFALAVYFLLASASLVQAADTRIAFVSTRHDERNAEIYLMTSDGKRVRRLTEHPQFDSTPAWSPDRQKITFMSFRDEPGDIYVMNPDGTNLINLTQSPEGEEGSPAWSPNGKQIAFTSAERFKWRGGYCLNIWVMDADGGQPRNLTNHDALDQTPDWSPDGRRIAFSSDRDGNFEIYVVNADGTNPINLTNHPAWDSGPSWGSVRPLRRCLKREIGDLMGKSQAHPVKQY